MKRVLVALVTLLALPAQAMRPLLTDDARVVGQYKLQLESWAQVDSAGLAHWNMAAFGPTKWLELTAGGVYGYDTAAARRDFGIAGPIFQAKTLFTPGHANAWPGVGLAVGVSMPYGRGSYTPDGWVGYGYFMMTQQLGQRVFLHANGGLSAVTMPMMVRWGPVWGTAAQVVLWEPKQGELQGILELYGGDPFGGGNGGEAQTGMRWVFSEHVQIDATFGKGLWGGAEPYWGTLGLRLVSRRLW